MFPAPRKRKLPYTEETTGHSQKSKLKMSLETYEKKQGLGQHLGGEYQYLMCAFYALKCASNRYVQDFKLTTTTNKYQVFDDITFEITWRNGDQQTFIFQLKHGEPQRNLTNADFQREHLKNKKYLKNPFHLQKHVEAIENTKEDNIVFVLFTNNTTSLDTSSKLSERVTVEPAKDFSCVDLLVNTERTNMDDILELKIHKSPKKFYFITNQKNVFALKHYIGEKLRQLLGRNVQGFFDFMKDWWAGNFVLGKTDTIAKLTELVLSPFIRRVSNEKVNLKSQLLARCILEFDVTIVESEDDIATKIWKSSQADTDLALKFGLISGKDVPLNEFQRQLVLWYLDVVPMVVVVDDGNQDLVTKVLRLWSDHEQRKKLVLLVNSKFHLPGDLNVKVLSKLSDLRYEEKYIEVIQKFQICFQGKEVTTIELLLQEDGELGDAIKVRDLLEMSQKTLSLGSSQDHGLIEEPAFKFQIVDEAHCALVLKDPQATDILKYFNKPINVVCGPVGIGKTVLLKQLNQSCSHSWSFYINLKRHNLLGSDDTLLRQFVKSDFEDYLVKTKKVYLFLDELDQVDDIDRVLSFVRGVASQGARVWIAARDQLKEKLAGVLKVVPIQLQLSSDQQREYLCAKLGEKDVDRIIEHPLLLGTPLSLDIAVQSQNQDDLLLEQRILDGLLKFCLRKQYPELDQDDLTCLQRRRLEDHQALALKCCLKKKFDSLHLDLERAYRLLSRVNNLGIVTGRENELVFDPAFVHYFAALWLSEHLEFLPLVQEDYFAEEATDLRRTFDVILAKDNPTLIAVIKNRQTKATKECKDKGGRNALHLLCSYGNIYPKKCTHQRLKLETDSYVAQLDQLFKLDFDITDRDSLFKFDCISYALHSGCLYPIELILEVSKDCQNMNTLFDFYEAKTLVFYSCQFGYNNLLNFVIEKTGFPQGDFGDFSLPQVVILGAQNENYKNLRTGNVKVLDILRTKMEIKEHEMSNLLEFACQNRCYDMIGPLNSRCENIMNNNTVLHLATKHDVLDEEIFAISEELGIDVGSKNMDGRQALHIACEEKHIKSLQLLVAKGADVNARCNQNKTPLHYAVGSSEIVRLLLKMGADPNLRDMEWRTPLDVAQKTGSKECVVILGSVSGDPTRHLADTAENFNPNYKNLIIANLAVNFKEDDNITCFTMAFHSSDVLYFGDIVITTPSQTYALNVTNTEKKLTITSILSQFEISLLDRDRFTFIYFTSCPDLKDGALIEYDGDGKSFTLRINACTSKDLEKVSDSCFYQLEVQNVNLEVYRRCLSNLYLCLNNGGFENYQKKFKSRFQAKYGNTRFKNLLKFIKDLNRDKRNSITKEDVDDILKNLATVS